MGRSDTKVESACLRAARDSLAARSLSWKAQLRPQTHQPAASDLPWATGWGCHSWASWRCR